MATLRYYSETQNGWLPVAAGGEGPEGPPISQAAIDAAVAAVTPGSDATMATVLANEDSQTRELVDTLIAEGGGARGVSVDVRDFGAVGDGVTDDTAAFAAALAAGAGGEVVVPHAEYRVSSIVVPTETTLRGVGRPTIIGTGTTVIRVEGTPGTERPLGIDVTTGARTITTTVAHGFAVGDLVLLMSQRSSLVADAGLEWRLGYATPASTGAYFAEWHEVASVESTTSFGVRTPVLFPDYFRDNTRETASGARAAATVRKVDAPRHVNIEGLRVTRTSAGGYTVRTQWAADVTVHDVISEPITNGMGIEFLRSFGCKATECRTEYDTAVMSEADHFLRNAYKSVSSQACGFDGCTVINGSQPFDITYTNGAQCSLFCYVANCETRGPQSNGMTTHGGSYMASITDNRFQCDKNGLSIRTRRSVVTGNIIDGRGLSGTYGLNLYEGWARDCVVSDNSISNFDTGIAITDAPDAGETFEWVGAVIADNTITNVKTGVVQTKSSNSAATNVTPTGITIKGNAIRLSAAAGERIAIKQPANASQWRVIGNTLSAAGSPTGAIGVYGAAGAHRAYLSDNLFEQIERGVVYEDAPATVHLYLQQNHWGARPFGSDRITLGANVNAVQTRLFDNPALASKALNPGTATGTDATVINKVITALRDLGVVI